METSAAQAMLQDAERIRGRARLRAYPVWSSSFIFAIALLGGVPVNLALRNSRFAGLAVFYWLLVMPAAAGVITLQQQRARRRFGVPVNGLWFRHPVIGITAGVLAAATVGVALQEAGTAAGSTIGAVLFNVGAFVANVSWAVIVGGWLLLRFTGPANLVRGVRVLAALLVVATVTLYVVGPSVFLEGSLVLWALGLGGLGFAARRAVATAVWE